MEVLNRAAIKKDARAFIGQDTRWWKMFLAMLPYMLLTGGVSVGVSFAETIVSDSDLAESYTVSMGTNILAILLIPFAIAIAGYFLNHIRGFNPSWQSLYKEGFDSYGSYLKTGFVTYLVIMLWSFLFIVPGIIMGLAYSQVYFIVHDNPALSPKQARDLSRRMTEGFKGDLFVLGFSFIPWAFFVCITCGIGMIYVLPYMQTVSAMYYENLKSYALATGKVRPEELGLMPVPQYGDVPYAGAPFANNNAPFGGTAQPPYTENPYAANQNPYAAPTNTPYAANPNPYNANPYATPAQPVPPAEPTFTPPAPEATFQPGDVGESTDKTVLNGEEVDSDKQDF